MLVQVVPEWPVRVHLVEVAVAVPVSGEVMGLYEVVNESMRGALREADAISDFAEPVAGFARDADKNASVVREQSPVRHATSLHLLDMFFMKSLTGSVVWTSFA